MQSKTDKMFVVIENMAFELVVVNFQYYYQNIRSRHSTS